MTLKQNRTDFSSNVSKLLQLARTIAVAINQLEHIAKHFDDSDTDIASAGRRLFFVCLPLAFGVIPSRLSALWQPYTRILSTLGEKYVKFDGDSQQRLLQTLLVQSVHEQTTSSTPSKKWLIELFNPDFFLAQENGGLLFIRQLEVVGTTNSGLQENDERALADCFDTHRYIDHLLGRKTSPSYSIEIDIILRVAPVLLTRETFRHVGLNLLQRVLLIDFPLHFDRAVRVILEYARSGGTAWDHLFLMLPFDTTEASIALSLLDIVKEYLPLPDSAVTSLLVLLRKALFGTLG